MSSKVKWNKRTDKTPLNPPNQFDWEHDETGEVFTTMFYVEEKYPEFKLKWADGVFGGYECKVGTHSFKTTEGFRGLEYKAVIAFDENGNGAVFFH